MTSSEVCTLKIWMVLSQIHAFFSLFHFINLFQLNVFEGVETEYQTSHLVIKGYVISTNDSLNYLQIVYKPDGQQSLTIPRYYSTFNNLS